MLVQNFERGQIVQYSEQKSGLSVSQHFGPEMYCSRYNSDFQQWGTLISLLRQTLEQGRIWSNIGGGAKHQNLVKNFLRGAFGAPKRAFSALRAEIWGGGAKPDFAPPSPPSYPPLRPSTDYNDVSIRRTKSGPKRSKNRFRRLFSENFEKISKKII